MDSKHILDYHGYAHCYWCGKPIKVQVEYDECSRIETRRCDCVLAVKELTLRRFIQDYQSQLHDLEINRPISGRETEFMAECEKLSYKYRGRGL